MFNVILRMQRETQTELAAKLSAHIIAVSKTAKIITNGKHFFEENRIRHHIFTLQSNRKLS
jgi:hypothetical protein